MAITPDKTQIEAAGLEYIEPHEIVADTGPKALNLLAQAVVDIQAKPATVPGDIPIFATLAEAEAYEAANPGRTALTIENQAGPITPAAPTFDDTADTYTIPAATGVGYKVDGSVVEPGTYSVGNVDKTVMVTAYATSERGITGTAEWIGVFTRTAEMRTLFTETWSHPDGTVINGLPVEGLATSTWAVNTGDVATVQGGKALYTYDAYGSTGTIYSMEFSEPGLRQIEIEVDVLTSTNGGFTLGYHTTPGGAGDRRVLFTYPKEEDQTQRKFKLVGTKNEGILYVDGAEYERKAHAWQISPDQTVFAQGGRGTQLITGEIDNIVVRVGS